MGGAFRTALSNQSTLLSHCRLVGPKVFKIRMGGGAFRFPLKPQQLQPAELLMRQGLQTALEPYEVT